MNPGSRVIDGSEATFWRTWNTTAGLTAEAAPYPHVLTVDLGVRGDVCSLAYTAGPSPAARAKTVAVFVSDTPDSPAPWAVPALTADVDDVVTPQVLELPEPQAGRFVTLKALAPAVPGAIQLEVAELAVSTAPAAAIADPFAGMVPAGQGWQGTRRFAPAPAWASSALLAGPDRGLRWQLDYNAKDLSYPFTAPNNPAFNPYLPGNLPRPGVTDQMERMIAQFGSDPREVQLYFFLYEYTTSRLPDVAVANMRKVLDEIRSRGWHVVLRFAYNEPVRGDNTPSVADIKRTIDQVAPIVAEYRDILSTWQVGFVHWWGEWSSASAIAASSAQTDELAQYVVDNLPEGIGTAMRYPYDRRDVTDAAKRSRIGFQNDYLMGTISDVYKPTDRYHRAVVTEAPWVFTDGEMGWDIFQSADSYAGVAVVDPLDTARQLQYMHYSTFSIMHNYNVSIRGCVDPTADCSADALTGWQEWPLTDADLAGRNLPADLAYFTDAAGDPVTRTAYEYIRDHLGYRLELTDVATVQTGADELSVGVSLRNLGFAAPQKDLPVRVTLMDEDGAVAATAEVDVNTREWLGAPAGPIATAIAQRPDAPTHSFTAAIDTSRVPAGEYWIGLEIGDAEAKGGSAQVANQVAFTAGRNAIAALTKTTPATLPPLTPPDPGPSDEVLAVRAALAAVIDQAATLNRDGYTQASWPAFAAALSEARALATSPTATIEALRETVSRLARAMVDLRRAEHDAAPTPPPTTPPPPPTAPVPVPPTAPPPADANPPGAVAPPAQVARVKASQKTLRLKAGTRARLRAEAYLTDGSRSALTWSSTRPSVARVSAAGVVTAGKRSGTAVITATAGTKTAKIRLTVVRTSTPKVASVTVQGRVRTMAVGDVADIVGVPKPARAVKAVVTYRSSKPQVAQITPAGRLVAKAPGTTRITVRAGGKSTSFAVRVRG
jgi:alkylated DNA nucleotide flippase Atl1